MQKLFWRVLDYIVLGAIFGIGFTVANNEYVKRHPKVQSPQVTNFTTSTNNTTSMDGPLKSSGAFTGTGIVWTGNQTSKYTGTGKRSIGTLCDGDGMCSDPKDNVPRIKGAYYDAVSHEIVIPCEIGVGCYFLVKHDDGTESYEMLPPAAYNTAWSTAEIVGNTLLNFYFTYMPLDKEWRGNWIYQNMPRMHK